MLLKIAVIIPVYNKIEIIGSFIEQNLKHASSPQEWIIIDNASDQPTQEGIQRIKKVAEQSGHRFTVVTEPTNTGVAAAWNKGLSLASSSYCCILNNDCVLMPGWDKALIEEAERGRYAIFTPLILEPPMFSREYTMADFISSWRIFQKRNRYRFRRGFFGGVVFFGKKTYFDQVGKFDETYWLSMEDMDYLMKAMSLNLKVGIVGNSVGYHLAAATRQTVYVNEGANQHHFEQKWGWNFHVNEKRSINKWIRSWRKIYWKYTKRMSLCREQYPVTIP